MVWFYSLCCLFIITNPHKIVQNGDLNWIKCNVSPKGYCTLTTSAYIPYFKEKHVSLVVRLNKKCYDETDFLRRNIQHMDQYYLDGLCPPTKILNRIAGEFETVPPGGIKLAQRIEDRKAVRMIQ